jgi:hypothetical protein
MRSRSPDADRVRELQLWVRGRVRCPPMGVVIDDSQTADQMITRFVSPSILVTILLNVGR